MLRSFTKLRLVCKAGRPASYRNLSEVVHRKFDVQQGGSLLIDFHKSDHATIEITTAWQDHCDVEYDHDVAAWDGFKLKFTEDLKAQKLTVFAEPPSSSEELNSSPIKLLKLTVPEMLNVSIMGHHVDLKVRNKLLGDFVVLSNAGTVNLDKLRGTKIVISCPESDVVVNKLLEGSSQIKCKTLTAKMINGDAVILAASDSIDVGAMYSKESSLQVNKGNILLGLMQGNTKVIAGDGDVTIMGIDGSFEVDVSKGNITLQVNKISPSSSQESSTAITLEGNIHTTVDPELIADVSIESFLGGVNVLSDAFERKATAEENHDCIEGRLTGQSKGLKRPTFYREGGHSGKIDMQGAEDQSLHSVSEMMGNASLRLVAAGDIKLETLSWIEAIRRRHITGGEAMPDMPLGRRAAAFQKLKESAEMRDASAGVVGGAAEVAGVEAVGAAAGEEGDGVGVCDADVNTLFAAEEDAWEGDVGDDSAMDTSVLDNHVIVTDSEIAPDNEEPKVSLNLDNIPGMQTAGEKYVIMFTCNVCETRAARKISKRAYHHGVVICRCDKCKNLHLIADRMGVFEDDSWDIQKHMMQLLERENVSISHEDDILEVTQDEEEVEEEDEAGTCADELIKELEKELGRDLGSKK